MGLRTRWQAEGEEEEEIFVSLLFWKGREKGVGHLEGAEQIQAFERIF